MARNKYTRQALSAAMSDTLSNSRVLMVGAGGIGCELLKNLALMGFGEIHVVDLDTIDLSNLNRQFLFRKEHIRKPKAHVAKEAALKFNPHIKIESYHANIKDAQFSRSWFRSFDLVFNALDNVDARKYVNKMCISVDVPLVESGTTGFHGQAFVIKKGVTACYECEYLEPPKTFPVCTIRNTPSQPIHCIVWAKSYLFTEVFGAGAESASELNFDTTSENQEDILKLKKELLALKIIREAMGKPEFAQLVFDKVYKDDISASLLMEDMWVGKRKPEPMEYANIKAPEDDTVASQDLIVWDKEQCVQVFNDSIQRLSKRIAANKDEMIDFDKDDADTLDFVAAAANLRCYIFGLEPKSKFTIKQMAGNIIPAIATTNAIIAGACVLQAIKVFQGHYLKPGSFVTSKSSYRLMNSYPKPPNPKCLVCTAAQTDVTIRADTTLGELVDGLKSTLDYKEPEIYSADGLVYEEDEDSDDMLTKKLADLNIESGSSLRVLEDPRVELVLNIVQTEDQQPLAISKVEIPTKPPQEQPADADTTTIPVLPSNGVTNGNPQPNGLKRSAEEELVDAPPATKVKTSVVEDADGSIIID